nr:Spy/CpxP family protein refolding chaperone [uncultured Rhodoferax sp.]
MKTHFKTLIIATLLAGVGVSAFAYKDKDGGHMMDGGPRMERSHRMDPAKMEEMHAKRSADLKAKLKITTAQEGAWTTFTAAMKPPARDAQQRPDRAELEKLSTPERLDKMRALRTQHMTDMNTAMEKRDQATKALYATLSADQKKLFDAQHAGKHGSRGGRGK